MDDGKEPLMIPPGFELDPDDLMPSIDADSFLPPDNLSVPTLPDNLPAPTLLDHLSALMPPDDLPTPTLPDDLSAPMPPDNLSVPDEIEAGIEALFEGAPSFERPDFNSILAVEPDYIEAELDYPEEVSGFGAAQQLIPFFSRSETALVPAPRVETSARDLALVPTRRAEPLPSADFVVDQEKYVVFSLSGTKYAVPMSHILEVCELEHFTPVPNVPEWVMGITNLRGDIASIVNTRALL